MASFSDAHETMSIPLIAANLQLMVAPKQNQIWAVMRKEDSDARIYYSLVATFLGRMGLSGDIYDLSDHQWKLVEEGIDFYHAASDIIKNGTTTVLETDVHSWNEPKGSQVVVREYNGKGLVVLHRFGEKKENSFILPGEFLQKGTIEREYGSVEEGFSAKAWILCY